MICHLAAPKSVGRYSRRGISSARLWRTRCAKGLNLWRFWPLSWAWKMPGGWGVLTWSNTVLCTMRVYEMVETFMTKLIICFACQVNHPFKVNCKTVRPKGLISTYTKSKQGIDEDCSVSNSSIGESSSWLRMLFRNPCSGHFEP